MSPAALRERAAGGARGGRVAAALVPNGGEIADERARMAGVATSEELTAAVTKAMLDALDGLTTAVSAGDMPEVCYWLRWQAAVRVAATERGRELAAQRPRLVDGLSDRLVEVAGLVAEGLSNRAIARRLGLAEDTTKHHVSALIKAFGVEGRAGVAVAYLRDVGQLPDPTATPARAAEAGGSR